jgi:hypothetical protein
VSRQRLPRAEKDLYSRHSQRIVRARQVGELDFYAYAVLSFFVDLIDLPGRDGEVIFTLEALTGALEWPLATESLRQKLHGLRRQGWIEFESPRRGPGAAWIFRLSGAAIDAEREEFPISFQPETPSQLEINSNHKRPGQVSSPQPDSVSGPLEFPNDPSPRAEQSRAEALSEEWNDDHVVGKTTAVALDRRQRNGDPHEREQSLLADCQTLVDAGLARWREDDDGSEWR